MSTVAAAREHSGELTAQRDAPLGGQAVMEGVMMRGVSNWAVGVRKPVPESPDGPVPGVGEIEGEIEVSTFPLDSVMRRHRVLRLPIIRGVVALGSSMAIGFKALEISANAQLVEEPGAHAADPQTNGSDPQRNGSDPRAATASGPQGNGAGPRQRRRGRCAGSRRDPPRGLARHDRGGARAGDRPVLRRARRPDQPDQGPARLARAVLAGRGAACARRCSSATCSCSRGSKTCGACSSTTAPSTRRSPASRRVCR